METEARFNTENIQFDAVKDFCNHPMLHPTLTTSGFHTEFYTCVKCNEIIQDTQGTMRIKQLFF